MTAENDIARIRITHWTPVCAMIAMLTFYCTVFPADKFNIKEVLLALSLLLCMPYIGKCKNASLRIIVLFYGIIYPLFFAFTSILSGTTIMDAVTNIYMWVFIVLAPAVVNRDINIWKSIRTAIIVIVVLTLFIYLLDILNALSYYENPIRVFFTDIGELRGGKGIYSTFGYAIFFKSSPLLYFLLAETAKKRKYPLAAASLLALFASGSRANAIVGVAIIVFISLLVKTTKVRKFLAAICVAAFCLTLLPVFVEKMQVATLLKGYGDEIKYQHALSIFEFMNDEPLRYLFGSGIGSYFYSSGTRSYINVCELSYYDYFRQVGLLGFIPFCYFILYPLRRISKENKWLVIPYIGYLATAATNPLLVNSTAFMVYLLMYTAVFGNREIGVGANEGSITKLDCNRTSNCIMNNNK